jgi:iron complex transport system substrate-binding protein
MQKKWVGFMMALVLVMIMAACGAGNTPAANTQAAGAEQSATQAPEELTIKHQLGETKVKKNPKNVVVFDFGILDSLDKLGIEVLGVPQANIPPYLEKYKDTAKYKNVGSLVEPDFEKISTLKPELIIISARQSKAYEELSKIGPTVYLGLDTAKYMESFTNNMKTLGTLFDKASVIDEELKKVEAAIQVVKGQTKADQKALIVLVTGGKASAYGAGSRFGVIHDVLGVPPVDNTIEVSTHGMSISFEFIAEKNPDYLFVVDRDAATAAGNASAKQVIENELVKGTKAFKNDNIIYLDPNYWYLSGGGLISTSKMVEEVAKGMK